MYRPLSAVADEHFDHLDDCLNLLDEIIDCGVLCLRVEVEGLRADKLFYPVDDGLE